MNTAAIIALAALAVAAATFFIGRLTASKTTGQQWGELLSDVKYIKEGMNDMKGDIGQDLQEIRKELAQERKDRRDSVERLHNKIESHVKDYHGGIV